MRAFEWASPTTVEEAVQMLTSATLAPPATSPTTAPVDSDEMPRPMAGGQDLLSTMKTYIMRPPRVVNLKTIT